MNDEELALLKERNAIEARKASALALLAKAQDDTARAQRELYNALIGIRDALRTRHS